MSHKEETVPEESQEAEPGTTSDDDEEEGFFARLFHAIAAPFQGLFRHKPEEKDKKLEVIGFHVSKASLTILQIFDTMDTAALAVFALLVVFNFGTSVLAGYEKVGDMGADMEWLRIVLGLIVAVLLYLAEWLPFQYLLSLELFSSKFSTVIKDKKAPIVGCLVILAIAWYFDIMFTGIVLKLPGDLGTWLNEESTTFRAVITLVAAVSETPFAITLRLRNGGLHDTVKLGYRPRTNLDPIPIGTEVVIEGDHHVTWQGHPFYQSDVDAAQAGEEIVAHTAEVETQEDMPETFFDGYILIINQPKYYAWFVDKIKKALDELPGCRSEGEAKVIYMRLVDAGKKRLTEQISELGEHEEEQENSEDDNNKGGGSLFDRIFGRSSSNNKAGEKSPRTPPAVEESSEEPPKNHQQHADPAPRGGILGNPLADLVNSIRNQGASAAAPQPKPVVHGNGHQPEVIILDPPRSAPLTSAPKNVLPLKLRRVRVLEGLIRTDKITRSQMAILNMLTNRNPKTPLDPNDSQEYLDALDSNSQESAIGLKELINQRASL